MNTFYIYNAEGTLPRYLRNLGKYYMYSTNFIVRGVGKPILFPFLIPPSVEGGRVEGERDRDGDREREKDSSNLSQVAKL